MSKVIYRFTTANFLVNSKKLLIGAIGFMGVISPSYSQTSHQTTDALETVVSIPSEGRDIPGVFTIPAVTKGKVAAVLMLHGYAGSADEVGDMYGRLAEHLAKKGTASLRIDFAGMGSSKVSTHDYDYHTQTTDAAAALDWLIGQEKVDPTRVGVQGFSNGAFIGSHLVGVDSRPIAFSSWSGAIYNGDPARYEESLAKCLAKGENHIELDLGWRKIDHSCEFFTSMAAATPLDDFANFSGSLLLIAGTDDTSVLPSVSEQAGTASASKDVTVRMIMGADHIFHVLSEDQTLAQEVITTTADWFEQKL